METVFPMPRRFGCIETRWRRRARWRSYSRCSTLARQAIAKISAERGHLNRQDYIARGGQILDASIVPVPRNHNTRDENAAIKKGEVPEGWTDKPAKRVQKDVDAPSPDIAAQRTAEQWTMLCMTAQQWIIC